jgi:ABC-type cobalamin transport system ATPase subunit
MRLRPFSSSNRGMFISIDGPSGAGKSTIVRHLAQMLVAVGQSVHMTAEPSSGPIGALTVTSRRVWSCSASMAWTRRSFGSSTGRSTGPTSR